MAAGRAAGIQAKAMGKSRKEIRAAIQAGMSIHLKHAGVYRPGQRPAVSRARMRAYAKDTLMHAKDMVKRGDKPGMEATLNFIKRNK
jgi:hypothetical protein